MALAKVMASRELSLAKVTLVCESLLLGFHWLKLWIDVGIVIDLEPANSSDPALLLAGAVQSQKLVVRSITRLQSLPGGDIGILCDTAMEDVQKLTGYDRVMVYKFHDDNHGEIVFEIRRSDLEPYLGLQKQKNNYLHSSDKNNITDCLSHGCVYISCIMLPQICNAVLFLP
ncbi:Phytochrome E [Capsicum baccatum]|uniref:Phytochrome E n=1 Tax=Capsicum baccatum TaxID=33114 RepID=A0A2G2X6A4_CAPBA|nr:Phytochrome E [Capsicum baccatum]